MDESSKAARDFSSRGSRIEGSRAELNQQGREKLSGISPVTFLLRTSLVAPINSALDEKQIIFDAKIIFQIHKLQDLSLSI
jgi:hypothetical protein